MIEPKTLTDLGSNAVLGAGVFVDGVMVAWFADFTEEAREWCTENYFGRWLVWRATTPEIVPITPEELEKVEAEAQRLQRLADLFKEAPNAAMSGEPKASPLDGTVMQQEDDK